MEELGIGWRILAGLVWLVACWLALIYVAVPLTLVAVAAGLSVGTVLAAVGYLRVYVGVEDERVLIEPATTLRRRSSAPYRYWDKSWPGYLTGQLERDIVAALAWPRYQVRTLWRKAGEWARPHRVGLAVALPAVPPPVGFLAAMMGAVYAAWLAFGAASEAVALVPRLARWAAIAALRAGDASVRWRHGAAATCPGCRRVTRLPGYLCGSRDCKAIHRDLRPGRLGVWCRRCHCHARLPSTAVRAASALTPVCPACENVLHERAGVASDARIALSGDRATGKTQLLRSAMAKMTDSVARPAAWAPADEDSATRLYDARKLMAQRPRRGPAPTEEPVLLTLRDGTSPRKRYVHLIDVGGQQFMTAVRDPALEYLGTTRRHMLVLDPTTIPSVRDRIDLAALTPRHTDDEGSRVAGTETSSAVAELPYRILVAQLNRFGARTRRCSLAVVITKADLLAKQALAPEPDPARTLSHRLRAWLCAVDLRNLVETAEQDFGKVRYFLVGAGMESTDPVAPFTWLLNRHRRGASIP
jgi:hypothetical protein